MKLSAHSQGKKLRKIWIPILVILLIAAGGLGYLYWSKNYTTVQTATTTYKTSQVKRGSITLSVSGSGTLVASKESQLSFSTTGTVAVLNVQTGDTVKQGQVLAQLDALDTLQAGVNSAQQDLISAQKELETLKQSASANLANAQLSLATAQKAVIDAKSGAVQKGMARCDQTTIEAYYYKYTRAKSAVDDLGDGGGNQDYYLNVIVPARNAAAQAYALYESCTGFTDYEISSSQATLSLDQAKLQQAQETLNNLTESNGLDPIELATAKNNVSSAQLALTQAKEKLEGATLKAPFDGTVLSVAGQAGDSADTSTFITLADLAHPQVEFSIDETDMEKAAVGEQASLTFDALPDQTFKGTVLRINPALETSGGYQVIKGLIQLDASSTTDTAALRKGLNASIELVQASAKDVLLVPVQAVRNLGDGTYGVFVVGADGTPKMKVVEVGLQDAASAEIKSGLAAGDVVTTGVTQTK
jgi:HlyD family secretion protein